MAIINQVSSLDPAPAQGSLQKAIYQSGVFPSVGKPQISGIAAGMGWSWSDVPTLGRATVDLIGEVAPQSGMNTTDMTLAYQLSGFASAVNALTWASGIGRNLESIDRASALGDRRGALLGRLSLLTNLSGVCAGLSLGVGFRVCSIASAIHGSSAPSLLGRVTYGFLFAGLVLFSVINTLITALCSISLYEGKKLQKRLDACATPAEKITLLQKKLQVDPAKIQEKIEKAKKEGSYAKLLTEASNAGKNGIRQLLKEIGVENVSDARLNKMLLDIFREPAALVQNFLDLKLATKKQEKLSRVLGSSALEKIRSGNAGVIEEINAAFKLGDKEFAVNLFTLTLSSASLIAAIVLTGGVGVLIGTLLMVASSITMLALDCYYFNKSLAEDCPGPHDKKLIAISTLTCVATLVTFVALNALGVVSFGAVPLIAALVLGTLWLSYNAYTWHAITQKEAQIKKDPQADEREKAAASQALRNAFKPYLVQ